MLAEFLTLLHSLIPACDGFIAHMQIDHFYNVAVICYYCEESRKMMYGLSHNRDNDTNAKLTVTCLPCIFHPPIITNRILSVTCLPCLFHLPMIGP